MIKICVCYVLTELSVKSAEVIVLVAFNALKLTDVSKSQLVAAAKSFGRKLPNKVDKASLIKPVAASLVKNNGVKVLGGVVENLSRVEVKKVGNF